MIPGSGRSAGEGKGYPLQYPWASVAAQPGRPGFDPWVGNIAWRRERLLQYPGVVNSMDCHGPWDYKELDTTEQIPLSCFLQDLCLISHDSHRTSKRLPMTLSETCICDIFLLERCSKREICKHSQLIQHPERTLILAKVWLLMFCRERFLTKSVTKSTRVQVNVIKMKWYVYSMERYSARNRSK